LFEKFHILNAIKHREKKNRSHNGSKFVTTFFGTLYIEIFYDFVAMNKDWRPFFCLISLQ